MKARNALWALIIVPGLCLAQNAPVAKSALTPSVESHALGAPQAGGAGLLPPTTTGLPATLWQSSDPETVHDLIRAVDMPVPAMRVLMRSLMLAEAAPPLGTTDGIDHLTTRLDWLMSQGAVEEALALLEIAGTDDPRLFSRWADLNLLLGRSEPVCLSAQPGLNRDLALRVFCTARGGDWTQAALILRSADALGELPPRKVDLLARFLDHTLNEDTPSLLPPVRPTPLEFRLFEALGEPLPTAPLPLAFSVLDLSGDNGWRAQIEAAERLARVGSLPANRILGLYSLRKAAASGGVWDRVQALQKFETALQRGAPDQIGRRLMQLWPQMASARLLPQLSELYAKDLADFQLKGRADRVARLMRFLSPSYEELSLTNAGKSADFQFLTAIARGQRPEAVPNTLPHAEAIAQAFDAAPMPDILRAQIDQGRLGEVILRGMSLFASGAEGNGQDLVDALATFRALGLEDTARQAALQLAILDAERARR
ncbi:MAG: hypothetical protein N4A70_11040 [Pelagimonas sp.]|jgi:hypothetical protein|nr:hypothetical protein [Pelagimonas sp.]